MSDSPAPGTRPRVIVCGTGFGRVYLAAFDRPGCPFELAGILAQGSSRSRACAQHYGVELFTEVADLPADIDIACVVVGSGVLGGPGADLAQGLMGRGIHVLQEHPVHHDELAACLRAANRNGVCYHLNTHYVHLAPVREFIIAARMLLRDQDAVYVDAVCGIQVAYTLLDILCRALGGLRPWDLATVGGRSADRRPFRSLEGMIAGVPLTMRVQNELDPRHPDSNVHILHRITIGTDSGNLLLANTHGPTIWSPRQHMPRHTAELVTLDQADSDVLDVPSAAPIGPPQAPSQRAAVAGLWPAGVRRALGQLHAAMTGRDDTMTAGQYHLGLSRLWQRLTDVLGYPQPATSSVPRAIWPEEFTKQASL